MLMRMWGGNFARWLPFLIELVCSASTLRRGASFSSAVALLLAFLRIQQSDPTGEDGLNTEN